ncbi:MAG TPA: HAMP domain-containing protein, partial [Acidimicrobiales bacterium]|nr:HAMP domain-containing protein [Acidimicrobiales bacterium]
MRTPSASATTAGPAGPTAGAARRRSLRTRWTRALAVLLALFAAGGLASFAATRSTVGAFRQAALRMDQEADVLARLRADIVSSALLRSAAVQDPAADRRELDAAVAAEAASFERAVAVLRPGGGREIVRRQLARARELWSGDVTTLTPAQFLARVAEGRRNFELLDEAGAASRAKARADLAGAAALERNLTVATALAALAFIALVVRLARRLSTEVLGPVASLRDSAGRLAAGDLDHRVEVGRADEIGDLAATFNAMADFVATSHRSLTR